MGTRNLIAVYLDGEYKVAQYSQWDGYPEGNGIECLHFLRNLYNEHGEPDIREMFRNLSWYSKEELDKIYGLLGVDESGWLTIEQSKRLKKYCPELNRDTGAGILDLIVQHSGNMKLCNSLGFAKDGLFCEWAWVIDLDKNMFQAYEGYNKHPLKEGDRFYSDFDLEDHDYYGPKFVAEWDLMRLPSDEEFLKAFKENE